MFKLTPTARLVLLVLRDRPEAVDQTEMLNLIGATPSSLLPTVRALVRTGHLERLLGRRADYRLLAASTAVL